MQEQLFNKHLGSTRTRSKTPHRNFKNTKQFIEAVADLPDEDLKADRRKSSVDSSKAQSVVEPQQDSDEEEEEKLAPFLETVNEKQICSAFELAARCLYCPINHKFEMISTFMANDFEYLKKALGFQRHDLRAELRSAKRKSRLIIEEQQQRLNNLDNHFYYKREAFESERQYESWKQREKSNIERLINQLKQVPPFSSSLSIKILGGKEFLMKDGVPQPVRPYCILTLGKVTRQTQILEKTVSPQWHESYNLNVASLTDQLQFEVFDKALLGSNSLGYISVPLSELDSQAPVDKWYPLQTKAGDKRKATGSLHLFLHLTYREGPLLEKDEGSGASPFYYSSTNYNQLYQILLYSLSEFDKNPVSGKLLARQKDNKNGSKDDDEDDDVPAVVKWEDLTEVKIAEGGPESRKKRAEMMKKEGVSNATAWLLQEFAQRYGIGQVFGLLAYLEMLVIQFKLSTARMDLIHDVLIELKVLTSTNAVLSIPETQMDETLTKSLKRLIGRLLKDYHNTFAPNKVGPGALGTAVVILSFLSTHNSDKLCTVLVQYVKHAVEKTYQTFKKQASGETPEKQLVVACGFIPAAIEHDKILFSEEFPKEMNLTQVLAEQYYALISRDVLAYYSTKAVVSPNTFDLYDRLRDLQEVLGIEGEKVLPLKNIFQKYIDQWLSNFVKKVKKWNEESISSDAWYPCASPTVNELGSVQTLANVKEDDAPHVLHSSSVVELFASLTECRKFMHRIKSLQSPTHPVTFAKAVSAVIEDYVQRVQSECFQEIHADAGQSSEVDFTVYVDLSRQLKKKLKGFEKGVLIVRKELCVRINNIEHILDNMPYFCQKVDATLGAEILGGKTFTSMMQDTVAWLESARQEIIDAIINKMNTFLQLALEISVQPPLKTKTKQKSVSENEEMTDIEKRLEALIAYLSTQLIVLSDNLYFPVFVRLLDSVWLLLLKDMELMIVPPINEVMEKTFVPNDEYRKLIPEFLEELKQFIHAEGAGLPMETIEAKCTSLLRTTSLFEETSQDLMLLFKDLEMRATQSAQLPEEVGQMEETILSILAQRKHDKNACKFVKANKTMAQNIMLRKQFELDSFEVLVDKFRCSNAKLHGGWLYITTSFVCFDTLLQRNDSRLILRIEDIREVKKYKFAKIIDNGIKIIMKTGKKYRFSAFYKRNQALTCILNQAKQLECNLGLRDSDKTRTSSIDGRSQDETESYDWSDSESDISSSSGSLSSYRKTDASGGRKKGIKSRIARKLGHKESHKRSQSLNVDPADVPNAMLAVPGRSQLSQAAKAPRSAASSPMTNRARAFTVRNRPGSVQIPASDLSSLNSGSDDDTFDALDDDFDTDEDFPSDSEDATNDIQLLVTPASKPQSSAFKKGHKRGQSVDHQSARRAILQEEESPSGGTGRTSSSRDLKASSNKLSNKEEKVMAKAHAREEKAAAKELKEQKRKEELKQKKAVKLVKRFGITESSKFLGELKCTYLSGNHCKGKIYIFNGCLCFYSSALAAVIKIVVPWGAINSVAKRQEKKGDAIEVTTNDNTFVFVGFADRDNALEQITKSWQRKKRA